MLHITTFRKIAVSLAMFAVVALGSAMTTKADQITVFGSNDPNLQATINILLLQNNVVIFRVTNVPVAGVTSSITGIGFDLPGVNTAINGLCAFQCGNFFSGDPATGFVNVTNSPGTVPNFPAVVLDWAVITGPSFAGGNPPGIDDGITATFTVGGNFTGLTPAQFLAGVYVRFQGVSDPAFPNVSSDVAHVPEPATMLLLGTGLVGIAAGIRRRRKAEKLE